MLKTGFISIALLMLFSFTKTDEGTYKSTLTGKQLSETPFGNYIKENVAGDQMIIVVSYGCDHCWDATKEVNKLKKENLIDNILILGTGSEAEKAEFKEKTGTDYKMTDYDFETMKNTIKNMDASFPPPPFAIWVKDNIVKAVFVIMPSAKTFKKLKE